MLAPKLSADSLAAAHSKFGCMDFLTILNRLTMIILFGLMSSSSTSPIASYAYQITNVPVTGPANGIFFDLILRFQS